MNKRKFVSLILLMVLSLAGIIWVQVTWVGNSIRVANWNFDNFVKISLMATANKIESEQRINFLNRQFLNVYSTSPSVALKPVESDTNNYFGSYSGSVTIAGDMVPNVDSVEITISTNDNPPVTMKVPMEEGKGKTGQQNVMVSQDEYLNWIQNQLGEFQSVSSQLMTEMYNWGRNINISKEVLNRTLRGYLTANGIETPFEFALMRGDSIYDGYYSKLKAEDFRNSPYQVSLFSDGLLLRGETISVVFPKKTKFVLGSIGLILGGSSLFSLIIILTFAFSLYFIITQKKISEMKSDFINNMTHEFKTPIATISLAADTITNQKIINDEGKVKHFVGMIKKENARMNSQVETILQMATLDKHEMEFSFREIDLNDVVLQAIDTVEIQVTERGGVIKRNLEAERSALKGDSEHLRHLVHNLLDNANKYSESAPEITISTGKNERGINLVVEDKGIGMTKAVQSRIFERFYRQTSGNIHNVKGFGLGLNYVKAIVDAHGGTITVESEPGKGSRFTVFLPFNMESGS